MIIETDKYIFSIVIADTAMKEYMKIKSFCVKNHIRIFYVNSSKELIKIIRKRDIDLIIINTELKDIAGHKLIPIIKDINSKIKIIVITEKYDSEIEKASREKGIIYFAIKPIDEKIITNIISNLMHKTLVTAQ